MQLDMTKWAQTTHRTHRPDIFQQAHPEQYTASLYWQLNWALAQTLNPDNEPTVAHAAALLTAFCAVANQQKWTYLLLVEDDQLAKWQQMWHEQHASKVYLIAQQQLNEAYFHHQSRAFQLAWHVVLKYLVCELKFTPAQLMQQLDK